MSSGRIKPLELTKQQQINEIIRCGKDPIHFIRNHAKIQHPQRGTIPFETYPFQDDCIAAFEQHRFNIICKSRQLGLSTSCAAYAVWLAIFYKDKNILVIATKLSTAMNFIKKVTTILQSLPTWLLLPKFEPSKQAVSFSNGSQIKAVPTSEDAGRSEALSLLVVDEAAFIRDFDTIWTGLYPTLSTGGRVIVISTPNGVGGQYYKLWTEAEAGVNDFNPIKLMWDVHPEHDQAWFDKESRQMSRREIGQELLCVGGTTKIITPEGYKYASDLGVGDLVLTHRGRFRPVENVCCRYANDDETLIEVNSPGNRCERFVVTGNHPTLSYRFWANHTSSLECVVNNCAGDLSWIAFDQILSKRKATDRIVNVLFPLFRYDDKKQLDTIDLSTLYASIDVTETTCRYTKQWGSTKRFVSVDFELGKFVGLYLAEGCNARGGLDMGFHINEMETHARWVVNFLEKLGCRTTLCSTLNANGCRLWTFNKHVGALVRFFVLGNVAHEKVLDFEHVLSAGREFIKGLLVGHHLGDGDHKHISKTRVVSTSSKLIYQLRTLNSIFGLYPRIGHWKRANERCHDGWYLEFQAAGVTYEELLNVGQQYKKGSRTRLFDGNFVGHHNVCDVSHLRNVDGGFVVYDISVADDHSFVAESAILHNCDFTTSGDTYLQPDDLERIKAYIRPPIERAAHDRNMWVWAHPVPDRKYVMSADVSRGDAHDYSAIHIIDAATCDIMCEYMGKVPPEMLADMMFEWGTKYNTALAVPENNTYGWFVCQRLRLLGYKRLYYHDSKKADPFTYTPIDPDEKIGFPTDKKTRVQILTKLENLIRNQHIRPQSQRLYDQLLAFVWKGSKPMASRDSYDDLVMSLAIAGWLLEGNDKVNESTAEMMKALLRNTTRESKDRAHVLSQVDNVKPLFNAQTAMNHPKNVLRPRDPSAVKNADLSDFSWLLK